MGSKQGVFCFWVLVLFGCLCEVQLWPRALPKRVGERETAQEPTAVQSKQMLQASGKKLSWSFPETPKEQEKPVVDFHLHQPVAANSVAAQCGESMVRVEVKKDLFGIGNPIQPAGLTMGGCAATGEDHAAEVLVFESALQGCGGKLTVGPYL